MASTVSGFNSHLACSGIIGHTNCDIEDTEGLTDILKTYMKTDTFRSNAAKVLKAHAIDPSTVKNFHVDLYPDGSLYLILPESGRKFKLSNDPTVASSAFSKTQVHPQKARSDLIRPYTTHHHPEIKKDSVHEEEVSRELSTYQHKRPESPPPPYVANPYQEQPPLNFTPREVSQGYGPMYPQAPMNPSMLPIHGQPSFHSPHIIGYMPSPTGELVPIYDPRYGFSSFSLSSHPPAFEAVPRATIHGHINLDTPLVEEVEDQVSPLKEKPEDREEPTTSTPTDMSTEERSHILETAIRRADLLRAVDKTTIEDYVSVLESQKKSKLQLLDSATKELKSKQSFFNQLMEAAAGSHELYKEDVEELEDFIANLETELMAIEAKLQSTKHFLSLPDSKRLEIIRKQEQALRHQVHHLETSLAHQKSHYIKLHHTLQKTHLEQEHIKYEDVKVEDFLRYYAKDPTRITYDRFQELLKEVKTQAETRLAKAEERKEFEEEQLPFGLMEFLFSSVKDKGLQKRSEIDGYTQDILKQKRIIRMVERLQKVSRVEYLEKERKAFSKRS